MSIIELTNIAINTEPVELSLEILTGEMSNFLVLFVYDKGDIVWLMCVHTIIAQWQQIRNDRIDFVTDNI